MTVALDPAIERVLLRGLQNEGWPKLAEQKPSDRGGLTRGGITAEDWGTYKHLGRPATADELNAITQDEALTFYYQGYVLAPHFDQVADPKLRALLIDWSFTSCHAPIIAMQKSMLKRGVYKGSVDGVIGPQTIAALFWDADAKQLYRDVFNARVSFYLHIAFGSDVQEFLNTHPSSQLANLNGWVARALEFTP